MYRCFTCRKYTLINATIDLEESDYDKVIAQYTLIRIEGPTNCFDEEDNVVVCRKCVEKAL